MTTTHAPRQPKTPSFSTLKSSSQAASAVGRANRSVDTKPEVRLRRALFSLGLRYRTNSVKLPGRPDIVFRQFGVVVFCDGDFWHGRNWSTRRKALAAGHNANYWVKKIANNRLRDRRVNRQLRQMGWRVIRVWESDVKREPREVAIQIRDILSAEMGRGLKLRVRSRDATRL